jgi:hypothetical protein
MIEQVAINLNYDNNRLQAALDAFFQHKDVKKHLFKTNFNNAIEEIQYEQRLWDLFELKLLSSIDGNFSIVQFDKKSIITKSNYKVSNYASNDYKIDEISLKNDPLFLCLKNNPKKNLAIGMLRKGTIIGYESEKKPVLLYPIRDEKNNIVKVAIIIQPLNYYTKLYSHLERLKMGTLFVSDDFGNIMFANHPSSQDDFEFFLQHPIKYSKKPQKNAKSAHKKRTEPPKRPDPYRDMRFIPTMRFRFSVLQAIRAKSR